MDIEFLEDDDSLSKIMGKEALRAKELIESVNPKSSNDLIEKILLIIAVQACSIQVPSLTKESVSEFKAVIDLKKIGLVACNKLHKDEFLPNQKSIPSLEAFDEIA